ncbi:MAG: NF038143 family protein [Desulfobacterales bacterium]
MTDRDHPAPYDLIRDYEEQFVYELARGVVDKPEISVWMILIPILFVHHMYLMNKYKNGVHSFARGIMEPKLKALDKALKERESGTECRELPPDAYFPELAGREDLDRILLSRQVRVINLLKANYRRLMDAGGSSYGRLLRRAYPEQQQYKTFISGLTKAERDLNQYLTENFHTSEASLAIVRRMEEQCRLLRKKEFAFFYNSSGSD